MANVPQFIIWECGLWWEYCLFVLCFIFLYSKRCAMDCIPMMRDGLCYTCDYMHSKHSWLKSQQHSQFSMELAINLLEIGSIETE